MEFNMITSDSWINFVQAIEEAGKMGYETSSGQPQVENYYKFSILMQKPSISKDKKVQI